MQATLATLAARQRDIKRLGLELRGQLGLRQLVGVLVVPMGLVFSVAFYVSLWFTYRDSFGAETDAAPD